MGKFTVLAVFLLLACGMVTAESFSVNSKTAMQGQTCDDYRLLEVTYYKTNTIWTSLPQAMCWAKFSFNNTDNQALSTSSNWNEMDSVRALPDLTPKTFDPAYAYRFYQSSVDLIFGNKFVLPYAYLSADQYNRMNTDKQFSSLCNGTHMIVWIGYGTKQIDTISEYYIWLAAGAGTFSAEKSALSAMINRISAADYGSSYICINTINSTYNSTGTYNIGGGNITTSIKMFNASVSIICEGLRAGDFQNDISLRNEVPKFTGLPPNTYQANIEDIPSEVCVVKTESNDWWSQATRFAYGFLRGYGNVLKQVLPTPIYQLIAATSEMFNLVIAFLMFTLVYQVVKHFLVFRRAMKSSLTKASVVIAQLFFWFVVALLAFWMLSHVWSFCFLKGMTILGTLKFVGIELKAPSGLLDVGAYAWDVVVLTAVGTITATDCAKTWMPLEGVDAVNSGTLSQQMIPLTCNNPAETWLPFATSSTSTCSPFIIRATIITTIFILLIVLFGIIWEMFMYIYRKLKHLEEDVRGPRTEEYEEGQN